MKLDPQNGKWNLPRDTDVVFLALHGTYGEDGTVQRRLEELGVTYTGCDAEASRIGFDKVLTKQRCVAAGVPTARFLVVDSAAASWPMGWHPPVVVKPVRQGSSVGLQFVERVADWSKALAEALKFDSEVLVEEKIVGRECTVGILADEPLPVVEVRPKTGIYDYQNKYTRRRDGVFLPGALRRGDDRADSGCRARRVQGRWRPRLCARGRDGACRWRTGGAGSQHAAGHDGNQLAAESGGGGGIGYAQLCQRMVDLALQDGRQRMWFKAQTKKPAVGPRARARRETALQPGARGAHAPGARWRWAPVFGTVFGLYLLWRAGEWALDKLVYENEAFAIQHIDVQTDGVIAPDQLRRWAGVKPGDNLLALDLARVKRNLELVPLVQSVSVERILPRTLRIRVTEREPVAQVNVPRPRSGRRHRGGRVINSTRMAMSCSRWTRGCASCRSRQPASNCR